MKSVETITPASATTISDDVASASTGGAAQFELGLFEHRVRSITAKPAQPRNAPRPWAVMNAYHVFAPSVPMPAWLSRIRIPSRPEASRMIVDATR